MRHLLAKADESLTNSCQDINGVVFLIDADHADMPKNKLRRHKIGMIGMKVIYADLSVVKVSKTETYLFVAQHACQTIQNFVAEWIETIVSTKAASSAIKFMPATDFNKAF